MNYYILFFGLCILSIIIYLIVLKTKSSSSGYNCINSQCVQQTDNPQYKTLDDCINSCKPPILTPGYVCDSNYKCDYVADKAKYTNLNDCLSSCQAPPPSTAGYNCVNYNCTNVANNAQYTTLTDCQNSCHAPPPPPITTYNCQRIRGIDTCVLSANGQFSDIGSCQYMCPPK